MTYISYDMLVQKGKRKPRKKEKVKICKSMFNGNYVVPEVLKEYR